MTPKDKSKRTVPRTSDTPRPESGEVHDRAPGGVRTQQTEMAAPASKDPPFRNDPVYRKLLADYQSGEWQDCLLGLETLIERHPRDKHLLAFKADVQLRAGMQARTDRNQEVEQRADRRKVRQRTVLAVPAALVLLALLVWFFIAYGAEETRQELAAQAAQTAEALTAKETLASTFMRASKPEQALDLYREIQKTDPSYKDIDESIAAAEDAIQVEGLYQEAMAAMDNGDLESALERFRSVAELEPEYKDTGQKLAEIERQQQMASLVAAIEAAFQQGDSQAVIQTYDALRTIDPFIELPQVQDELFYSYRDLVLEIAMQPDPTLAQIQDATKYYRLAMALFPQSLEYARQREELQDVAIELVASQYYLQGINILASSDYSIEGLEQSILVLQRARAKAPDSRVVDAAIQKTQFFIDAYDQLLHGDWDNAIPGFEAVLRRDANFAEGRAAHFLYEAYTARGDLLMLNADFGGALEDFQAAERFAWTGERNPLKIFEIETRVASALRRMGKHDEAAEFYHSAFAQTEYGKRLPEPDKSRLRRALNEAELAYTGGEAFDAVLGYEEAMTHADELYELVRTTVMRGDALPNIAFENGTTLAALRSVNSLGDSMVLARSRDLSVPQLSPLPY